MEENSEMGMQQNWFRSCSSNNLRHPSPSISFFMLMFMFIAVPSFLSFSSQFIKPYLVLAFLAVLGVLLCRSMAVGNREVEEEEPHHHYNHQHQPLSNFLLNYGFYIIIILIIALVLIFIVTPFLSFFSQNFKPNVVKKNWGTLNLVLVFLAIICGLLSFSTTDVDEEEEKKVEIKERVGVKGKEESEILRPKKKKVIHHHYHFHHHHHPHLHNHHHHHHHHLRRLRRHRHRTINQQQLPIDTNQQQVPTDLQQLPIDTDQSQVPTNQQQVSLDTDQQQLPTDTDQQQLPTVLDQQKLATNTVPTDQQQVSTDQPRLPTDREEQLPTTKFVPNGNRMMRRNSRSYSDLSRQESYQILDYESPAYYDDINVGRYRYGSIPQGPQPSAPPLITKEDFENFSRQCSIGKPQSVVDPPPPSQPPPPPPVSLYEKFLKRWKRMRSGPTPPPPPPPLPSLWALTTASTSSGSTQLSGKSPEKKKILDRKDSDAWMPPIHTEYKINFSAAWITPEKVTGIGLILRDSKGLCRGARGRKCFSGSSEEASAGAALEAVKWAKDLQLYGVTFEGDSKCIIEYLHDKMTNMQESTASVLKEALQLSNYMSGGFNMFQFVSRNANKVANETAILVRISETSFDGEANLPSYIYSQLANERVIETL